MLATVHSFNTSTSLSDDQLKEIDKLRDLILSDPNSPYLTTEFTNYINDLSKEQVDLISKGDAPANPALLKLLNFGLELTL